MPGIIALLLFLAGTAAAGELPTVAIVIDDLGNQPGRDRRVLDLPGPITLAILPHTPHGPGLAAAAIPLGREVMLHLPMQAAEPGPLGEGALMLDMDEQTLRKTLDAALKTVPGAFGVNNHMGSLLTRHPGHMAWLMRDLASRDLYFLDSRTTPRSVAATVAAEERVSHLRRDVFLDGDGNSPAFVRGQLERLVSLARKRGHAVAIGHPLDATLDALEEFLPVAESRYGVRVVPLSRQIAIVSQGRTPPWQASLSHSPKTSKTSRPSP